MKILCISALSSERVINDIYTQSGNNPGFAVQKFNRLILRGLKQNGIHVVSLGNPPVTRSVDKRFFVYYHTECENGLTYKYTPFVNLPIIKHLCVCLYVFLYVLFWGLTNRSEKSIVCDVLSISACFSALTASKINRVKSVAVVTDIYSQMTGKKATGLKAYIKKLAGAMQDWYSTSFTHYVLLTEAMNDLVNPHHRPYIVMEALCDNKISNEDIASSTKANPREVMYAGGLEFKYGLKMLVEAFRKLELQDVKLVLYGHGEYVDEVKEIAKIDPKIDYRGIAPNEVVVKNELSATLLVNPRLSSEELTKYSFPSKNMEYMTTGTPLLTTRLSGMPIEYNPHVYFFDEETVEGFASTLTRVLCLPQHELTEKGRHAREFVLDSKNNLVQTKRLIQLLSSCKK